MKEQLELKLEEKQKLDLIDVPVWEESSPELKTVEEGMQLILSGLDIDMTDPNFEDTPKRVARAFAEIFRGLFPEAKEELGTHLSVTFPCDYKGLIIINDIVCYSTCPHHILPVKYLISIGYIPHGKVLGASKLPRIATLLAARPVLQEQLTEDIVNHLQKVAHPLGAIVIVKGEHLCMKARGIKQETTSMITSSVTGVFLTNDKNCKEEFFTLLEANKK